MWPINPHSDILHQGDYYLLVTIFRWTFNIAQISLHMWHFCFCVMCSSCSICYALWGSGFGFGHSPAVRGSDAHLEVTLCVRHWVLTEHL